MYENSLLKIFSSEQVREIDAFTIKNEPIASIDLMERAARSLFGFLQDHLDSSGSIKVFAGPGNNGGDGLALARMLAEANFMVEVFIPRFSAKSSTDFQKNRDRLKLQNKVQVFELFKTNDFPGLNKSDIIIDAIFGSGLSKPLSGPYAALVQHLNNSNAEIIAVDIPSGLFGENNSENEGHHVIQAKTTLSIQFPKLSFMFAENQDYVGDWFLVPIGLHKDKIEQSKTGNYLLTVDYFKQIKRKRKKFSHKGSFGHSLLISGCYGRMGAAVLASKAALRSGTGLFTAHVPGKGIDILQTAVPEAMISVDQSEILFSQAPDLSEYDAIGVGPALGCRSNSQKGLSELLNKAKKPMVIDADGINILAENQEMLKEVPDYTILTPHPKEFERLVGSCGNGYERNIKQVEFAKNNKLILVLKGANTSIACPDGTCYFNSTGNPGMATAGSGDVLTGIILALLAQAYEPKHAAQLGVFVHGLAGDLAAKELGHEALIASDIINFLGKAFSMI